MPFGWHYIGVYFGKHSKEVEKERKNALEVEEEEAEAPQESAEEASRRAVS